MRRAVLLAVLVAAGCGGQSRHEAAPAQPHLPRALAHAWARQADAVAAALAAGDGCTARSRAAALRKDVIAAVNAHRVPPRFLEPLTSGVNELVVRTACTARVPRAARVEQRANDLASWLRRRSR